MTVKVYIWKGTNPDFSVYNGVLPNKGNVGHVAIHILDDTKSNDDIYISHRPGTGGKKGDRNLPQWIYVLFPPAPRAENITFEQDCEKRIEDKNPKGEPHAIIPINGLDENQMRALWREYTSNKLEISKYHLRTSNCSRAVATFLQAGLKCPKNKMCFFCAANHNVAKSRARRLWITTGSIALVVFVTRTCVSSERIDYQKKLRSDYYRKIKEQYQQPVDPNTGYRRIELPPENQFDGQILWLMFLASVIGLSWFVSVFFDIELFSVGFNKGKLWSPQTVEIFANKTREHVSQQPKKLCKRKRFIFF
ncbi:hypothetical protein [Iningainema tapete]|uniref:Uncharacterized protein n=1 Tax=Iningainema tapete BLCC-T55 TaxID=2748662 RepID=A0A8J7C3Y1_9CYAN|nr:hypothetical protein [Iningainema tapete]MBD2770639.1 hypothetical protein [Iningainema tapete BLCC-T55]